MGILTDEEVKSGELRGCCCVWCSRGGYLVRVDGGCAVARHCETALSEPHPEGIDNSMSTLDLENLDKSFGQTVHLVDIGNILAFCPSLEIIEDFLHPIRLEVVGDGLANVNRCVVLEELFELLHLLLLVLDLKLN